MSTYSILLKILDKIREEAPSEFTSYKPIITDVEKLNYARSKAYIHLFLKVSMGILDFKLRESYITDGAYDGGIDAYYIQEDTKTIFFIQSKFRTTELNFHEKYIDIEEILKMDIDRILDGERTHENGVQYNAKILEMQRKIKNTDNIGRYRYEVVILANLHREITPSKLRLLTTGIPATVFDYKRTYSDLVFPILTGTYYNFSDLNININLTNKSAGAKINYSVDTELGTCDITVLFAPLYEIGKLMYEYKNSILKYNPRSYLSLKEGSINEEIKNTIIGKSTNEFALYNNGITILSDDTVFNERIGQKDKAQLCLKNPQIINGGQTAFTISLIYEESIEKNITLKQKLEDKEVLVKIITFNLETDIPVSKKLTLIESISDATNKQNQVNSADRSSNNPVLIESQKKLFNEFGYLLERKRGEFYDGLRYDYIEKKNLIDRGIFMRIAYSTLSIPNPPSRKEKKLLTPERIDFILNDKSKFRKYFFGCLCYSEILSVVEDKKYGEVKRSGLYSAIAICVNSFYSENKSDEQLKQLAIDAVKSTLSKWGQFEEYVANQFQNSFFFKYNFNYSSNDIKLSSDYSRYYRSNLICIDLNDFFMDVTTRIVEADSSRRKLLTIEKFMASKNLTPEIIKEIKPYINPNNWFDTETISMISEKLSLNQKIVYEAIKAITSKEIGYYFRQFYL